MPVMSNVANVIDRHVRSVVCNSFQGGVVQSNGEATDNTYITSTKQMAVLQSTAEQEMIQCMVEQETTHIHLQNGDQMMLYQMYQEQMT